MEMTLANFVISLLGLVCVLIGGLWTVYIALACKIEEIDKKNLFKIDDLANKTTERADRLVRENDERTARIYTRMDENKKQFYDNFVLIKVYDENKKHQQELTDQKFLSMIRVFETSLNSLSKEFKDFKEYMIDRFNHVK